MWWDVGFDPQGRLLVGSTRAYIEVWQLNYGQAEQLWGKGINVSSLIRNALSPSGRFLAVAGRHSTRFEVLDATSGKVVARSDTDDAVGEFCWAHNEEILATLVDDENVSVWRKQGDSFKRIVYLPGSYCGISLSPDGLLTATCTWDLKSRTLAVETVRTLDGFKKGKWRFTIAPPPDGYGPRLRMSWCANGGVLFWCQELGVFRLTGSGVAECLVPGDDIDPNCVPSVSPDLERIAFSGRHGVVMKDLLSGATYPITPMRCSLKFYGNDHLLLSLSGGKQEVWQRRRPEGAGIWDWPQGLVALGIAVVALILIILEVKALRRSLRASSVCEGSARQ
jgi:WD40 repeat protein